MGGLCLRLSMTSAYLADNIRELSACYDSNADGSITQTPFGELDSLNYTLFYWKNSHTQAEA